MFNNTMPHCSQRNIALSLFYFHLVTIPSIFRCCFVQRGCGSRCPMSRLSRHEMLHVLVITNCRYHAGFFSLFSGDFAITHSDARFYPYPVSTTTYMNPADLQSQHLNQLIYFYLYTSNREGEKVELFSSEFLCGPDVKDVVCKQVIYESVVLLNWI